MKLLILIIPFLMFAISGCSSQQPTVPQKGKLDEPLMERVRIKNPTPGSQGDNRPTVIEKNLVKIQISPKFIRINESEITDLETLASILKKSGKPVITISSHRCTSTEKAVKVMELAQSYTDIPIAFGSYGNYNDDVCKK